LAAHNVLANLLQQISRQLSIEIGRESAS